MNERWVVKNVSDAKAATLSEALMVSAITAQILIGRGLETVDDSRPFLAPALSAMLDPFMLKGMHKAVDRLALALKKGETVCVYGDYDVDGISGTALLVSFLRRVGLTCSYFIPNRFDDGYGLNEEALQRIIDSGSQLIVSVDCGITSVKEAVFCQQVGVDLIILDHHTPVGMIPEATAVVNPQQPGCEYPFKMLAGVGVAFNLLVALRSRLRSDGAFGVAAEPDLRDWLDLVALGTIADVVPLIGQNRIYVHFGLQKLEKSSRQGVIALKKSAGIKDAVSCGQVGFRLAPRLNAAGRMESAVPGVDLLLSAAADECAIIADELNSANVERQTVEREILEQAVTMFDDRVIYPSCRSVVLASRDWHQGVIGIVASRLVERYHRPTILLAIDEEGNVKGSGRSIPGFHLLDALNACSEYLERFGGHRYAAGVSLKAENVDKFAAAFEKAACQMLGDSELLPLLDIDAAVNPDDVTLALANELQRIEPFGAGNPEPTLMMCGVSVIDRRVVGDGHLKLSILADGRTFNAIAFRQADCPTDGLLDIAFTPECNTWNNTSALQLRVKAMRKVEV